MSTAALPLLFPQLLATKGLDELEAHHGLTQADLDWLQNVSLPTHAQRAAQTPPMIAETIQFSAEGKPAIALAGCFCLRTTPRRGDTAVDPAFLYTPWDGVRKFDSPAALRAWIDQTLLDNRDRNNLFRLLSIAQRSELKGTTDIEQSWQAIDGDVFETQLNTIEHAQHHNVLSMVEELVKLPPLATLLDQILGDALPGLDPRQVRIALSRIDYTQAPEAIHVTQSIPLSEAVLVYFHHQGWPAGHLADLTHPDTPASSYSGQEWEAIIKGAAIRLIPKLIDRVNAFWDTSGPFHTSRRQFLAQFIQDALWAAILIKREKNQLTEAQGRELLRLFRPSRRDEAVLFIETVRLWEYAPNFVELAGSLMVSGQGHYLYTPTDGLQVVGNYLGFKEALVSTPEQKEAIYNLLDLDERNRLLGFEHPHICGEPIDMPIADSLAGAIIDKQTHNLRYALQMSRQGRVNVHALVDKALDIRAFISNKLLNQKTAGHWGTQPAFHGKLRLSNFLADQMERKAKSYIDVEGAFASEFCRLPSFLRSSLQNGLRQLLAQLTNVFSVGIRAEADLRSIDATLPTIAHELITTVFAFDPDYPDRRRRIGVRGFRPDVYSLKLTCASSGVAISLPLANCFLLTERGGLDTPYSGMAIVWTPADGLQAFASVDLATRQLNRQLLDSRRRFGLLSNLPPAQRQPHRRYQLDTYELIEDNVLMNRMTSFIHLFETEYAYLSALKSGDWQLTRSALANGLEALLEKGAPTNLKRATAIAQASKYRQKLPAWLGAAPLEDQRLHVEILEQYKSSVADGKDYLDGIEPLRTYVQNRLQALLDARFPEDRLNPETIQITPNLAVVGPASSLTDFALHPIDVTSKGFKVFSTSTQSLPDSLNELAVRQMLSSLDIQSTYKHQVKQALCGAISDVQPRKRRFRQQLPWQLLQYAHSRLLQQHISPKAFDLILQVLDMPDAIARRAVRGAGAFIRPLELIKTGGAAAVRALGLYVISSSADPADPHVLYAPYHEGHSLAEFKDEPSIVAALNAPGALQDLLVRRLPEDQRATFRNLFAATLGQLSEITLASNPIDTDVFETLYNDNATLLLDMLGTKNQDHRPFDWATVLHLFSSGIGLVGRQLPARLTFLETLWESYQDFKGSAEALQQHDWKTGLHDFIAGAAEMVSLGLLNRDDTFGLLDPAEPASPSSSSTPGWQEIACTAPLRTDLQAFEAIGISLWALQQNRADGTYESKDGGKFYVPLAGKVYQVARAGRGWRIIHGDDEGPLLRYSADETTWAIDPQRQTIRFGKAGSKMAVTYSDFKAKGSLNIEARGMAEIRKKSPYRANVIVQALETARFYSLNALLNLEQFKKQPLPGSRLDSFLMSFFGVRQVDSALIGKVETAIFPICRALADPTWEQQNASRIVIGNLKYLEDRATAFVLEPAARGRIYLTQFFFEPGLDWYKTVVPAFFNVDAHAQGATLIHEISHQLIDTIDIIYLDAALPFPDLISTSTHLGQTRYDTQKELQLNGLSLGTAKSKLFRQWDSTDNSYKRLELLPMYKDIAKAILKVTDTRSMDEARNAFLNPVLPDKRIDVILRNADSVTLLICELGRQLDPSPSRST
ncbi:hypothetical protein J3P80_13505 [Pseudomonas sp. D2-30]